MTNIRETHIEPAKQDLKLQRQTFDQMFVPTYQH